MPEKELQPEENVVNPWNDKPAKEKPAKPTEKTAKSTKVEKPDNTKPKEKAKQKRNGKPKISKYAFIHIDKDIYETLNLPKKEDIPITLKVDPKARTILVTIKYFPLFFARICSRGRKSALFTLQARRKG